MGDDDPVLRQEQLTKEMVERSKGQTNDQFLMQDSQDELHCLPNPHDKMLLTMDMQIDQQFGDENLEKEVPVRFKQPRSVRISKKKKRKMKSQKPGVNLVRTQPVSNHGAAIEKNESEY